MNTLQTEEQVETTVRDGYIVNIDTGEVIGHASVGSRFEVKDEDTANWVLEKLMDADAEIAKEQMKLKAVQERLGQNIKDQERRREWLIARFGPELEQFAKSKLEGAKAKNLKLTYGTLQFRTVKGGLRVTDAEAALEWAKSVAGANAIKVTEAFQISGLTDGQRELAANYRKAFEVKPDEQKFDIKSGVNL